MKSDKKSAWFTAGDLRSMIKIMNSCPPYKNDPNHHLGHPFMSAYQIAICFARDHKDHHMVQKYPNTVGGKGKGNEENDSLSKQIANFLSQQANQKKYPNTEIEGAFISHDYIAEFSFTDDKGESIKVSDGNNAHSIFRERVKGKQRFQTPLDRLSAV